MTLIDQARALLRDEADEALLAFIESLEHEQRAEWFVDPHVPNVVGLVDTEGAGFAYVIVYLDHADWEVDEHTEIDLYSID